MDLHPDLHPDNDVNINYHSDVQHPEDYLRVQKACGTAAARAVLPKTLLLLQHTEEAEAEEIPATKQTKHGNVKQQQPSNRKRAYAVIVDEDIELDEGQIRAQIVCFHG